MFANPVFITPGRFAFILFVRKGIEVHYKPKVRVSQNFLKPTGKGKQ